VSLLATTLVFWHRSCRADRRTRLVGVFSLFATSMYATLLGALPTLSPTVWYATYASALAPVGRSALKDQQLAGLAM
jgi:cytochrome c oxidase assembly factor CtaG